MRDIIKYRGGYKYQLAVDYRVTIPIYPLTDIACQFISLSTTGDLVVKAGYAWDGASGPTIDSKSCMRGALVHDCLYQMMRQQLLPHSWRSKADDVLMQMCIEDGMFRWRAWLWRKMVGEFADPASRHENDNPIKVAP